LIIDSSAIVQILLEESGWERLAQFINANDPILLSAANLVELYIVMESKIALHSSEMSTNTLEQPNSRSYRLCWDKPSSARDAFRTYGRGSESKARLNLGDCFAYALAKEVGEPLLFVGNDFVHTDIIPAIDPPIRPTPNHPFPT